MSPQKTHVKLPTNHKLTPHPNTGNDTVQTHADARRARLLTRNARRLRGGTWQAERNEARRRLIERELLLPRSCCCGGGKAHLTVHGESASNWRNSCVSSSGSVTTRFFDGSYRHSTNPVSGKSLRSGWPWKP